jgi:hypothetical protein
VRGEVRIYFWPESLKAKETASETSVREIQVASCRRICEGSNESVRFVKQRIPDRPSQ